MDLIGLVLAATFVVVVFAVFDLAVRVVCGTISDVGYSVASGVAGGLSAWTERRRDRETHAPARRPPDGDRPRGARMIRAVGARSAEAGLVVPVGPVQRGGRRPPMASARGAPSGR